MIVIIQNVVIAMMTDHWLFDKTSDEIEVDALLEFAVVLMDLL